MEDEHQLHQHKQKRQTNKIFSIIEINKKNMNTSFIEGINNNDNAGEDTDAEDRVTPAPLLFRNNIG